ncbi:MAG TPA: hypothetical protein VFB78_02090 [Acidimicrobiales bacterium]|nr:hypothetical protein [Acidimicrobiales bacterium]
MKGVAVDNEFFRWLRTQLLALGAVIVMLFAGGIAGAVTMDDADVSDALRPSTTTSTSDASGAATTTIAPPTTETTTASTVAPTPTTRRANPAGATAGPKPGTYRYHVTDVSDDDGEKETDAWDEDLVIVNTKPAHQQHRTIEDGEVQEVLEIDWRADGRYVTGSSDGTGGADADVSMPATVCDTTEFRTLVLPAVVGATWQIKSKCTFTEEGETYTIALSGTGRITERKTVQVGGTAVDVVHAHIDMHDSESPDDVMTIDELYAPELALTIEQVEHSSSHDTDDDGTTYSYDDVTTRRLQHL